MPPSEGTISFTVIRSVQVSSSLMAPGTRFSDPKVLISIRIPTFLTSFDYCYDPLMMGTLKNV
jgi:hypothetical protein